MSATPPLVSVVVPAYNRERTLGATLTGILTQTYPHVEAVVVDDGSSDRTLEIARAYESDRVIVVTQANAGPSTARNTAIAHARGAFIATCDSDDILLPNHIQTALRAIDEATFPRAVASCTAYVVGDDGLDPRRTTRFQRTPPLADQRLAMLQSNWGTYLMVAPRSLFEEVGGYDPVRRSSEDWDLWLRALYGGWNIVKVEQPTALYALSADSLTNDRATMTATENAVLAEVYDTYQDRMSAREREFLERRLREGSPMELVTDAGRALREGRRDEAAAMIRKAHTLNPREPKLAVKAKIAQVPVIGPRVLEWDARR